MTLLIMAAGNGSRYGALKQFDELGPNKEFLFEFSIYDAILQGFNHIVIITKEQFVKTIKDYLLKRLAQNITIDVIAQKVDDLPRGINIDFKREKPWGTAHAVWVAKNLINNNFVVINADDYYGKYAFKKAAEFINNNTSKNTYGLVPYHLKNTLSKFGSVSRGICKVQNNLLLSIEELTKIKMDDQVIMDIDSKTNLTGDEPTSMNFWIFNPLIFDQIEKDLKVFLARETHIKKGEIYIPLVIKNLIDSKKSTVKLTDSASSWFGITYADDKTNAVRLLKNKTNLKEYPTPLWKI